MKKGTFLKPTLACLLSIVLVMGSFSFAFANSDDDVLLSDTELIEKLFKEIEIDYGYELAKDVSLMGTGELGFRTAGSKGEKEAAAYIEQAMKDLGLTNVRQDPVPVDAWNFGYASLEVTKSAGENKKMVLSSYAGSPGTPSGGITGEIVYAGDGTLSNYEDIDVKGKIVLIELDLDRDYWIAYPAFQAELKGAAAIIALYNGDNYGKTSDAINSFSLDGRDKIPVMNISRNDGAYLKDLLEKGSVTATLYSDAKINSDGMSANVIGEIPGKMKDKYILFGAHYDGYFHAFQDDILGVGIFMTIAKAILDSGYQPEHTLVFIAFGSEEYGVSNTHYDWIRGSYCQVNYNTPEWIGNTKILLNFDTQRPDMKEFIINVTPEYNQFFEKFILSFNLPEPWVNGVEVRGTNGPWSDDYNFISNGIPGLIMGKGSTPWKTEIYHTNYDTFEGYNPVTFRFNVETYTALMLQFDKLAMAPLNFAGLMDKSLSALDSDVVAAAGLSDQAFVNATNSFADISNDTYINIQKANRLYDRMRSAAAAGVISSADLKNYKDSLLANSAIALETYKLLEKEYTKLDTWDIVSFGHVLAQDDFNSIYSALNALKSGDAKGALDSLTGTQLGWALPAFEKKVYQDWGIKAFDPAAKDHYWGTGKTLAMIDLYDVYWAINKKLKAGQQDFTNEINALEEKLSQAKTALKNILDSETALTQQAMSTLSKGSLTEEIIKAEALLASAYPKLPEAFSFSDVPTDHWAYKSIIGMLLEGIIDSGSTFDPGQPVTRIMFAKWLTEAFQLPMDAPAVNFTDVNSSGNDAQYIAAVIKAGLMKGKGNGIFAPNAALKRAELITVADNLLAFGTKQAARSSYQDVDMNAWYGPAVEAATDIGLVQGVGDGYFRPERAMTKAEACYFLETILNMK